MLGKPSINLSKSRQGRQKLLSSLTGLVIFPNREPSHKWLGYFQNFRSTVGWARNSVCSVVKTIVIIFLSAFILAAGDLRTNQLFIGDVAVKSTVSNGTIYGERWVAISNGLVRFQVAVKPLAGLPKTNSIDDSKPMLQLIFRIVQNPKKDKSAIHGGVSGMHGLLYMAKDLNTPNLTRTSRVDILNTEDKAVIVIFMRDNGPIYSSTNSGMTWTVINKPGKYAFPLTYNSDGDLWYAKATIHPSPGNQTSTNLPPFNWYALGSTSDGGEIVLTGNSAPILSIKHVSNAVVVSWPSNFTGFALQECSDLTTANWTDVTNSVNVSAGENQVIISPVTGNNFYQLKLKAP